MTMGAGARHVWRRLAGWWRGNRTGPATAEQVWINSHRMGDMAVRQADLEKQVADLRAGNAVLAEAIARQFAATGRPVPGELDEMAGHRQPALRRVV